MKKTAMAVALSAAALAAQAADKPADGATRAAASTKAAKPAGSPERAVAAGQQQVRNWAEIDTNRDNLISAEEMEKWLEAQRRK